MCVYVCVCQSSCGISLSHRVPHAYKERTLSARFGEGRLQRRDLRFGPVVSAERNMCAFRRAVFSAARAEDSSLPRPRETRNAPRAAFIGRSLRDSDDSLSLLADSPVIFREPSAKTCLSATPPSRRCPREFQVVRGNRKASESILAGRQSRRNQLFDQFAFLTRKCAGAIINRRCAPRLMWHRVT